MILNHTGTALSFHASRNFPINREATLQRNEARLRSAAVHVEQLIISTTVISVTAITDDGEEEPLA
jgi:hypothetical protein